MHKKQLICILIFFWSTTLCAVSYGLFLFLASNTKFFSFQYQVSGVLRAKNFARASAHWTLSQFVCSLLIGKCLWKDFIHVNNTFEALLAQPYNSRIWILRNFNTSTNLHATYLVWFRLSFSKCHDQNLAFVCHWRFQIVALSEKIEQGSNSEWFLILQFRTVS